MKHIEHLITEEILRLDVIINSKIRKDYNKKLLHTKEKTTIDIAKKFAKNPYEPSLKLFDLVNKYRTRFQRVKDFKEEVLEDETHYYQIINPQTNITNSQTIIIMNKTELGTLVYRKYKLQKRNSYFRCIVEDVNKKQTTKIYSKAFRV